MQGRQANMNTKVLSAFQKELIKIAQEGVAERLARKARVAGEFSVPPAEALALGLMARGAGVKKAKKLLAAGAVGAAHGIYSRTKKHT